MYFYYYTCTIDIMDYVWLNVGGSSEKGYPPMPTIIILYDIEKKK